MKHYPINLNLKGKKCLVAGGGKVGERKVLGLLGCGADVTVVSPEITPKLKKLSAEKKIAHIKRQFKNSDLKDALLAFAATDNNEVNRIISEKGRKLGVLVNVATNPKLCDFTVPSTVRRGSLMITVSTGSKSPALSKRLRQELEEYFGDEYVTFTEILGGVRKKLRTLSSEKRRSIYKEVGTSDLPRLIKENKLKEAEQLLKRITGFNFKELGISFK